SHLARAAPWRVLGAGCGTLHQTGVLGKGAAHETWHFCNEIPDSIWVILNVVPHRQGVACAANQLRRKPFSRTKNIPPVFLAAEAPLRALDFFPPRNQANGGETTE